MWIDIAKNYLFPLSLKKNKLHFVLSKPWEITQIIKFYN